MAMARNRKIGYDNKGESFSGFPAEIRIENTNLCNAHCVICPREKMDRPQGVMSMPLFRKVIDECAAEGCVRQVNIQGYGEPLLDPGFSEKVRYAKSKGMPVTYTVTNASLLTDALSRTVIESGLDKMKVSFYGTNERDYALIHRGLSFERVRENVLGLLAVKRRLGSRTPRVRVQYIGSPLKFVPFALQWLGKTPVGFNKLHNYGRGRSYVKVDLAKGDRRCRMVARPILQVLWNGDCAACCYDFNGEVLLGNVEKASIRDVWNGEAYEAFRRAHFEMDFARFPLCLHCDKLR